MVKKSMVINNKKVIDIDETFKLNELPKGKKLKDNPPYFGKFVVGYHNGGATRSRHSWNTCNKCGKQTRSLRTDKEGNVLCFNCWRSNNGFHYIETGGYRKPLTIEQALGRVYEVHGNITKKGTLYAGMTLPQVFAGRKVKLVLVE
jgi:hypothetical protein